ncbi:hypothetical protein, partial [Pseudomonas savastanoi]|uniref:hypothetical protein n=1 Tax=Pseudomonas savastanoi TaxID=29438 RepID=UPI001C3F17A9
DDVEFAATLSLKQCWCLPNYLCPKPKKFVHVEWMFFQFWFQIFRASPPCCPVPLTNGLIFQPLSSQAQ